MNARTAPEGGSRHRGSYATTSGLQQVIREVASLLEGWRHLTPRECAVALDVHRRQVEIELERGEALVGRWAA